jgi:pyruvate carboxylase
MVVDGVTHEVNWRKFEVGASFFIPCIHAPEAREDVKKVTRRLGFKVMMKVVIEGGIRGLRVWRIR